MTSKNYPIYFLGFSSSDGNSDGQKENQWFNPHSQKTVHGFDLSQVEDLEHIDHFNGMRNGATVTGEYSLSEGGAILAMFFLIYINSKF